jgi:hypothetical protein
MYFVFTSFWNYKVKKKGQFLFFTISWVPLYCSCNSLVWSPAIWELRLAPHVSSCICRCTMCTGSCCWSFW